MKNKLLKSFVGKKVFVLRGKSLDCGIFTNKNIGGYGKGIRGDYFHSDDNLQEALTNKGDCLNRRVFTMETINDLKNALHLNNQLFNSDDYFKSFVKDLIIKTRNSYCSSSPQQERKENVYVEIEDIFK